MSLVPFRQQMMSSNQQMLSFANINDMLSYLLAEGIISFENINPQEFGNKFPQNFKYSNGQWQNYNRFNNYKYRRYNKYNDDSDDSKGY